jgi:hypothetical protein
VTMTPFEGFMIVFCFAMIALGLAAEKLRG